MKLWEKGIETKEFVLDFTAGQDRILDMQIAREDIVASMAHVIMLAEVGLICHEEKEEMLEQLAIIFESVEKGDFVIGDGIEDIHSQIELILTRELGDTGKKIHTARSRNDQVITDLKLYYRSVIINVVDLVREMVIELVSLSNKYAGVEIPGYTHLQVAMPSSFGLWFGAYAESLAEDLQMLGGVFSYINQNPLGSAAGYGSSFPIDRQLTTELLGFNDLHVNSINAQMSRGKSERLLMTGFSGIAKTMSTMAMDMVLFMSQNFNFLKLTDDFTTGSSIMPHKKNPDILELVRAKANRIQSKEFEVFAVINNLPSGYHRDLQLLKEICFPAISDIYSILNIMLKVLGNVLVNSDNTSSDIYKYLGTVDAMSKKVMEGISYRDAYRQIAREIKDNVYKASNRYEHSHIGSIGNLGNERILDKMEKEYKAFHADKYRNFADSFVENYKNGKNA